MSRLPASVRQGETGASAESCDTFTAVTAATTSRLRRAVGRLARGSAVALVLTLVTLTSAVLTMRTAMSMHLVRVPNLRGMRLPQATSLLLSSDLTLRLVGKRHDTVVPLGAIVAQEPPSGSSLKTHRTVRAWLSLGPRQLEMPTLVGTSVRSARLALDLARLPLARVVEVHAAAPEGQIIMQWPPPGTAESADEAGVSLLVSQGPIGSEYVMPDLIGRPVEEVIDTLRRAELRVTEIRYRSYPGRAAGTVIGQYPRPGFRVGPRSSISLDVNREMS
jgi:beta-lactam-binding protein with PASTA domain